MHEDIPFAIIGAGSIAETHAEAITLAKGARLVAVHARSKERAEAFAKKYGAEYVPDLEALAERPDIQAVTIATPSGAHTEAALPFLRRGKTVLCEKPLDVTMEKVDNMLAVAEANGALLAGAFQFRMGKGARALKKAAEEGRFGRLALCSAYLKWWRDPSYYEVGWRGTKALDGGGALMNQGIHAIDLLQWVVGMPKSIFAYSDRIAHKNIEVEDTLVASMRFHNGAMGVIEASTACRPGTNLRIEVRGDHGAAILENDSFLLWEFQDERPEDAALREASPNAVTSGTSNPKGAGVQGHRMLVEDLVQAIRTGSEPVAVGREARKAVQIVLAAYQSAAEGRPVEIAD